MRASRLGVRTRRRPVRRDGWTDEENREAVAALARLSSSLGRRPKAVLFHLIWLIDKASRDGGASGP